MATITTAVYLDGGTSITAGEAMTINSGGSLTVRTDTRVHAKAPASNTGSLGSVTITEGGLIWDSTAVRWLAYSGGSGNVPAIGTIVTQGGVSGYLLGVWAGVNTAQTAVGSAMPTTGFIKFREVTGGLYSAGALTGIGASATGADVQGWISIAHDTGTNFTVPRLGYHRARGGKFFLGTTDGNRGQQFQVPSDGSSVMMAPGMFVETGVGTDEYEAVPALNGATNGWNHVHLGEATGRTDKRQNFVKAVAGGILQYGETWSASGTYASVAAQVGTYAGRSQACTYTWTNDTVEVYFSTGHFVQDGHQVGLQFTSGGAIGKDGIYTATVLDPYKFTVPVVGSGTGGNVTNRQGITITFTAHTLNIGDQVYCDFTSGTGVDGIYTVLEAGSANSYTINHPTAVAVTSGSVSCLHTLEVTYTAHGLSVGQSVYCNFTTGGAISGVYTIRTVPTANTFRITYAHTAAIASSNVTLSRDIGYVPPAGLRVWVPSNIVNEVATAARATNILTNATIASRPEWTTTSAGLLDLEYVLGCSTYFNISQAYGVTLKNVITFDTIMLNECASTFTLENVCVGMAQALDVSTLQCNNNYAGGTLSKCRFERGNTPSTSDHAISCTSSYNLTFTEVQAGIIQYARSTGYPFNFSTAKNIVMTDCYALNNVGVNLSTCSDITITNIDYSQRYNGYGLSAVSAIAIGAGSNNVMVDGMTFGYKGAVNYTTQLPYAFINPSASSNITLRNVGTLGGRIGLPIWAGNLSAVAYIAATGSGNSNIRLQRVYVDALRAGVNTNFNNSDSNITIESCPTGIWNYSSLSVPGDVYAFLEGTVRGSGFAMGTTGQASVYGTHFVDYFSGKNYGAIMLLMNEPNNTTSWQFTSLSGTPRFNSLGGILMAYMGDSCSLVDNTYRKGHTGFLKRELEASGSTITNFNIYYQIDTGSGYSTQHNAYYERAGGVGASGAYTFTVTDATGIEVGDYCFGTGLSTVGLYMKDAVVPKVTHINGNTITVDVANIATVSGIIRFTHLPSEVINAEVGCKLKYIVQTKTANSAALTSLRAYTTTTTTAQGYSIYPLDTITLTLTGLQSGSDIVILNAGTSNERANVDSNSGTTYNYVYETTGNVDIGVFKAGYIPFYIRNYALQSTNAILPIAQVADRNYGG